MNITRAQREVLIAHIDGGCPVIVGGKGQGRDAFSRWLTTIKLLNLGLLRPDRHVKPRVTFMTERGREELARALGELADVLVRAGFGVEPVNDRLTLRLYGVAPCDFLPALPTLSSAAAGPTAEPSARSTID